MKTPPIQSIIALSLLLLCMGCAPIGANPTPNPATQTSTPMLATLQITRTTAQVVAKTPTPDPDKPTQALATEYIQYSGQALALKGGLTDEGRRLLQAGENAYFFLAFSKTIDATKLQPLQEAGIVPLIIAGWIFAKVPPSALASLESWSRDGFLLWGGPLPPTGKIEARLAQTLRAAPNEAVEVEVILFQPPDPATRQQIEKLFTTIRWPQYMPATRSAFAGKIQSKNVEALSRLSIVMGILKPAVPVLP